MMLVIRSEELTNQECLVGEMKETGCKILKRYAAILVGNFGEINSNWNFGEMNSIWNFGEINSNWNAELHMKKLTAFLIRNCVEMISKLNVELNSKLNVELW